MFKILLKSANNLKIAFAATLEHIDDVADEVKKLLILNNLEDELFDIILGIREALTNAVCHGCGKNKQQIITFDMRLTNDYIITIEDSGAGFDWRSHLNVNLPTTQSSGRGIAIMKKKFNSINYNEKGNIITLKKTIKTRQAERGRQ